MEEGFNEIKREITLIEEKERIEFKLNAKGLYYWEFKIKSEKLSKEDIDRISEIDNKLKKKFPLNVANEYQKRIQDSEEV